MGATPTTTAVSAGINEPLAFVKTKPSEKQLR